MRKGEDWKDDSKREEERKVGVEVIREEKREKQAVKAKERARQMEMKEKQREGTRALATAKKVEETEGHWQSRRNGWKKSQRQKCYCEGRGGLKGDDKKRKTCEK